MHACVTTTTGVFAGVRESESERVSDGVRRGIPLADNPEWKQSAEEIHTHFLHFLKEMRMGRGRSCFSPRINWLVGASWIVLLLALCGICEAMHKGGLVGDMYKKGAWDFVGDVHKRGGLAYWVRLWGFEKQTKRVVRYEELHKIVRTAVEDNKKSKPPGGGKWLYASGWEDNHVFVVAIEEEVKVPPPSSSQMGTSQEGSESQESSSSAETGEGKEHGGESSSHTGDGKEHEESSQGVNEHETQHAKSSQKVEPHPCEQLMKRMETDSSMPHDIDHSVFGKLGTKLLGHKAVFATSEEPDFIADDEERELMATETGSRHVCEIRYTMLHYDAWIAFWTNIGSHDTTTIWYKMPPNKKWILFLNRKLKKGDQLQLKPPFRELMKLWLNGVEV